MIAWRNTTRSEMERRRNSQSRSWSTNSARSEINAKINRSFFLFLSSQNLELMASNQNSIPAHEIWSMASFGRRIKASPFNNMAGKGSALGAGAARKGDPQKLSAAAPLLGTADADRICLENASGSGPIRRVEQGVESTPVDDGRRVFRSSPRFKMVTSSITRLFEGSLTTMELSLSEKATLRPGWVLRRASGEQEPPWYLRIDGVPMSGELTAEKNKDWFVWDGGEVVCLYKGLNRLVFMVELRK